MRAGLRRSRRAAAEDAFRAGGGGEQVEEAEESDLFLALGGKLLGKERTAFDPKRLC